jgi:hypothetical protein
MPVYIHARRSIVFQAGLTSHSAFDNPAIMDAQLAITVRSISSDTERSHSKTRRRV